MKIKEINRTSTIAWSADVIPLLATGSVAGAVDLDFSSAATLEIWDVFGSSPETPIFSASVDTKFHALAWSSPFGGYSRGVLVGALENGTIQFWDVDSLIRTKSLADASIHTSKKHSGAVKCLSFNPHQPHVLASGGQHSEMFIWDLKTFADPISPGRPTTPMDEISCIAWNNAVSHILASTSNAGYTSIWDLKAKREVLHLAYTGALGRADFSHVAWHPTQSTQLITASQSDACPLIMLWDLRNATEPEKILQGHTKGVLSLDWCSQDPNLLISSGKDNSTRLWNPVTGVKLGDYPSATNWSFLARFAPRAPDVIATASFDGKVVVQTLQETSRPVSEQVATKNDDEFWSTIASADTQQAIFEVNQAPAWLKRPCGVSFGFGAKVVVVRNSEGKGSVKISKLSTGMKDHEFTKDLSAAIKSNDFKGILASKLENPSFDSADWEVLSELERSGKDHFLQAIIGDADTDVSEPHNNNIIDDTTLEVDNNEESFFASLSKDIKLQKGASHNAPYVPSGEFAIIEESISPKEARLTKLLLNNRISEAVSLCLEDGKLLEALVLSMDQNEDVKSKVKSHFFEQTKSDTLSRLIYSASSKDIVDIVSNADISNWKEIAASIAAYCKEENDFNSKTIELGDRIMADGSSDKENRQNALLCYLAGNALDKVAAIWLAELPELENQILTSVESNISSPHDARFIALGGFVEKVSVYRSLSNLSGALSGPSIEPVCKAVFEFSNMSASSGEFELASQFLALLPDDFAGLKTEKERIANATGAGKGQSRQNTANGAHANGNGVASSHGRYTNLRSNANPGAPKNPSLQASANIGRGFPPAAQPQPGRSFPTNQARGYAPPAANDFEAPANPYIPAGDQRRGSLGAQTFPAPNNTLGITPIPIPRNSLSHTGPIRPPSTPAFTQPLNQYQGFANDQSAPAPPPASNSSAKYKSETEGWNDLPETFKASKPPARRPPASSAVVAPSPSLSAVQSPQIQPSKRPQATHIIAPPPKLSSRSASKSSVPETPRITSSPRPSKYAPAVPPSPAVANGFVPNGIPSPVQAAKLTGPPKNPYAPAVVAQPKTTYVTPPTNNFVSAPPPGISRTASQMVNPYSPTARVGSRSISSGSVIGPATPSMKPPTSRMPSMSSRQTPVQQSEAQFMPPPPKVGSSRYTSPQLPHTNSNGNGGMAPPPVSGINNVAPPPISNASQVASPLSTSFGHNGPPPVSNANRFAPPQTTQQPPAAAPPVVAPPVAAPPVVAPPVAAPPVSAPVAAPPVQPIQEQHPAQSNQAGKADDVRATFATIMSQIKPAAPPKYSKHVLDMEKRLAILFDSLSKGGVLSDGTIDLLNEVATSLKEKNYQKASASNQQIGQQYPVEAGNWHTGVKRLVTMAEAFEI